MTFALPSNAIKGLLCCALTVCFAAVRSQDTITIRGLPDKTVLFPTPDSVPALFNNIPKDR
jgi:hypothetical protein